MTSEDSDLTEVRFGRNFIRPGDTVKVTPSSPGRRNGFKGKVTRIRCLDGEIAFDVFGAPKGRVQGVHTLRAERIVRVAQTRAGESPTGKP